MVAFVQIFTGGMAFLSYSTVIFQSFGFSNQLVLGLLPALAAIGQFVFYYGLNFTYTALCFAVERVVN